jgi:DNA transposition AAA+ family ATPase
VVKNDVAAGILPLRNVTRFTELVERVMKRSYGLPGMACFYGPSGYGKSTAAQFAINRNRAHVIEVRSVWGRKALCLALCHELSVEPKATIAEMVNEIGHELAQSRRPLVIDEADYLLNKNMVELVRDVYQISLGTIILIGEEHLPSKLTKFERTHGRMLDWVQAEPATLGDIKHLAKLYCRGIEIADDLLEAVSASSAGSIRRAGVNFDRIREAAEAASRHKMDAAAYTGKFFTGKPPAERRVQP